MSPHTNQQETTGSIAGIHENPWSVDQSAQGSEEGKQDGQGVGSADEAAKMELPEATELQESVWSQTSGAEDSKNTDRQEMSLSGNIDTTAASHQHSTHEELPITSQDPMESSTATLKPSAPTMEKPETYTPYDYSYLDPTPKTPMPSLPPSRSTSNAKSTPRHGREPERSPTRSDSGFDERPSASDDERESGSRSEIQTIMNQFDAEGGGPGEEEVMSPRLQYAGSLLGSHMNHPPRKSSLDSLNPNRSIPNLDTLSISKGNLSTTEAGDSDDIGPAVPPKSDNPNITRAQDDGTTAMETPATPISPMPTLHRPPPPEPEPEPDLPFDFSRFLEQMRHKSADPVAKYTRSFLSEFGKKQWEVKQQVKFIGDFLSFITGRMGQCEVWRDVSDAEFDNAREGMEKLIMNRLYTQTFSPAIPPPQIIPGSRGRGKILERPVGVGRNGRHQEDVEKDEILAQKISIYSWVKEEHLDIPSVSDSGARFLVLAQQELLKIKNYRAPRDKIIQVLNCSKVIFGLLRHSKSDASADSFMPLLIYTILKANPEHLYSNLQYIQRFRNEDKLSGEAGYYLSSLAGAVNFIENLDRTNLTISDEEFEENVEAAVSAIAEKHRTEESHIPTPVKLSEKAAPSRAEVVVRNSMEAESSIPRKSTSSYDSTHDSLEERPISGLLRTIQRPLTTFGRIFSDSDYGSSTPNSNASRTPATGNTPRGTSPNPRGSQSNETKRPIASTGTAEEAAARQASAESFEAQKMHRAEHNNVVETLSGMFPALDKDIISDVVRQKEGRVGLAVDACLALSS